MHGGYEKLGIATVSGCASLMNMRSVDGDLPCTYANKSFFCYQFVMDVENLFSACFDMRLVMCECCNR